MLAPLLVKRHVACTCSHPHIDMQYDVTPSAQIHISIINMSTQNNLCYWRGRANHSSYRMLQLRQQPRQSSLTQPDCPQPAVSCAPPGMSPTHAARALLTAAAAE